MSKRFKYWLIGGVIALGCAAGSQLLHRLPYFQQLSAKAYDLHFVLRGKRPVQDIVLVTVDEKSLNTFPELLAFWHPYYADAIKGAEMGGAKVIALDVAFGIPVDRWAKDNDRILAASGRCRST